MADRVTNKPRVLIFGLIARMPMAGIAWQALHYLEGFRRCGYDAYYVEDCWEWPYDAERDTATDDPTFTVDYLAKLMRWAGFDGRWVYRGPTREVFGVSAEAYGRLLREADGLVNVTGGTELLEEHLRVPVRIYLETDPVLPQIGLASGDEYTWMMIRAHTHHFTFGENYGAPDCEIPVVDVPYQPTRQPVVLDWWAAEGKDLRAEGAQYSTVATWNQTGDKDVEWKGRKLVWSKHEQFLKFLDLPELTGQRMELALATANASVPALLEENGWSVADAWRLSRDILTYRDYIRGARGEFTVAKGQVIDVRSGWFSDRSACYLAAGKPVLLQATGFEQILPTGRGLFAFSTTEDVLAAMEEIERDYRGNSRAAREIADEYFSAEKVVGSVAEWAGL
jgi:hypothetical protein